MTETDTDVLVVGGGPAGAATAAFLAERGVDVLIVDKARFPREKPCAEYLSPGVVDVLCRLGALERIRAADAAWPVGMRICAGREGFFLSYNLSYNGASTPRSALGITRPIFDLALLDHARARGARVREGVRVIGATVEAGRVVGVRAVSQSGEERLRARVVVAADGVHSAVTRSLALDRPVRWPRRLGLIARYRGSTRIEQAGEMHVGRGLYCGLAPVGEQLVNVGLVGRLETKPRSESVDAFFERRLAEIPGVVEALGGARRITPVRGVGPIARRVRRVAGPGYLLVGDAAGFLDPFTGEGVYRALRGAELAATAAELALHHPAALPLGYESARRAAFADKERVSLLVQLFLSSYRLFGYVADHVAARPHLAQQLAGVLGDYEPASPALRPSFLWSLLRP
jgi:geranylgeranyl reductase family protein